MKISDDTALMGMLKSISDKLFKGRTAKRCIIIGSNPSLKTLELAEYVDSYKGDVIRINRLPSKEYARNYGSRIDLLFAHEWVLEHYPQRDFNPKIVIGDFVVDLSNHFIGKNKPVLTTGIICILLALQKYERVEVMGFGLPGTSEHGLYKSVVSEYTKIDVGSRNFVHDLNYEHQLLWSMADDEYKGKLEILERNHKHCKSKCAFALYARGDRYLSYQKNLERELKDYVPDADIVVIDPKKAEACLPDIPQRSGKWNWDKSIFMRLAIPLMDDFSGYDRVIWLDVDVDIVSDKFASILDVQTSDDGLAAVRDSGEAGLMKNFYQSFPNIRKKFYCNSGVLVMDLVKIDKKAWKDKIHEGIYKHLKEGLVFPDQDILNAYFNINLIDDRYNLFSRELKRPHSSPWLIHYVAPKGKRMLDDIVKRNNAAHSAPRTSANVNNEPVDAVFVVGDGSVDCNQELRYALRSLDKNCKFIRDVYICGVCPSWVDKSKVKHLQWPDRFQHAKDANIIDKLRHACECHGIAKRILFCSDDQFQTRECTWEDFSPRYLRKFDVNDRWYEDRKRIWHSRLRSTMLHEVQRRKAMGMGTSDICYYQPHIWMPIDRDAFLDYAKWCGYERRTDTIIASGYYNFTYAHGRPNYDHVFLNSSDGTIPSATHVAYNDGSYRAAMRILAKLFPARCRFEIGYEGHIDSESSQSPGAIPVQEQGESYDPSRASHGELSEILEICANVRNNEAYADLQGEISRAEELRLFGVHGWRVVWRDIISRFDERECGKPASSRRSDEAQRVVDAYLANPEEMRTVAFGMQHNQAPKSSGAVWREKIRTTLRNSNQ